MQRLEDGRRSPPGDVRRTIALGCALAFTLVACDKTAGARAVAAKDDVGAATATRISLCTLMPKDEVNAITGASYTIVKPDDSRSSSRCHYSSPTDPAGMSLDLQWIEPSEYADPAEHAALQQAGMGGARLGGKLGASMVPSGDGGPVHLPSGAVSGVGDEATSNMLLLTARKGDYLIMVQITPTDMMALVTDSTAGTALVEREKAIARKLFTKL